MPAKVEPTPALPGLSPVGGKPVIARFDGGHLSSDGGLPVLREVERRLNVEERLAACLTDPRDPDRVVHGLDEIIRFRLLMIAAGYEDGNNADRLRTDPMFKLAMARLGDETGAMALALDTILWPVQGGRTTIGECAVGNVIMGADGQPTRITAKSALFYKPMYELVLDDGRTLKVNEDHLNQVWLKVFNSNSAISPTYTEVTLTTQELLSFDIHKIDTKGHRRPLVWIEDCKPIDYPENLDQLIDPYTVGVLLGDGSMNGKASGNVPVVLVAHEKDWPTYEREIPYTFGKVYRDKRNPSTLARTVCGINTFISMHGLDTHGDIKKIPAEYLYGSSSQRLALLQGLMDTDGTATPDGKSSFSSNSKTLVENVMFLARSLGGQARWISTGKANHFRASVRLVHSMFRLTRKAERQGPVRRNKIAVTAINRVADEPSQCIAVDNAERQFAAGDLVRTHNTDLRGTKIFGKRPCQATSDTPPQATAGTHPSCGSTR